MLGFASHYFTPFIARLIYSEYCRELTYYIYKSSLHFCILNSSQLGKTILCMFQKVDYNFYIITMYTYTKTLSQVDRIIFCVHQKVDYNFYSEYLHYFYPVEKQAAQPNGINFYTMKTCIQQARKQTGPKARCEQA